MTSSEYWAKREAEALKHRVTDEAEYSRQIKRIYDSMLDSIQTEIEGFYGRYASKEGITIAEAKKRVSALDIAAYERKAKRYVAEKDFSKKANEEMRLYNLTMKVNRLEMLKANIGLETIAGHDELEKFMEGILKGRTMDELRRQAGILGKSVKSNAKAAHAIVNGSFHNGTFSDRIWQYQDLMRVELGRLLQTGLIQGKNPRAIAGDLRKYWYGNDPKTGGGAVYCMERLMRTELARVQTEAQKQAFESNGFDHYEFIVNGGCCPICEGINGKHFAVSKMMPGKNAPPMHPNCRCSTAAWEDSKECEELMDYLANGSQARKTPSMKRDPAKFRSGQQAEPTTVAERPLGEFKKARTIEEAIAHGRTLTTNGIYSAEGLHLNTVNGFNEALHDVVSKFGRKIGITGVKPISRGNKRSMAGGYNELTKKISLQGGMSATQLSKEQRHAETKFDDGWLSSGYKYHTFYHEIGHAIWPDLSTEARAAIRQIYRETTHDAYETWMSMGGSSSGLKQAEVFGWELSRYAATDEQEFFSEAFSQIMSGQMMPVSRKVESVLNQHYKK